MNTNTNATEEYPIEPALFARALRQQRAMRLKGGLYHLNQVLMAYNTNRIEGSQLTEDQTRYIYETRTVSGAAVPVDDVIETANSFRLFDEMLDRYDQPITAQTLKDYHRILKAGIWQAQTRQASTDWFAVGDWKRVANVVGNQRTTAPEHVGLAIEDLLGSTPSRGQMTFKDVVDFHHRFESIHPFQDGNGRVGRIVMFQQCLQSNIMPFIVLDSQKEFYYRGLSEYENEPGFLRDTFRSFQDSYYARFAELVPFQAEKIGPAPEKNPVTTAHDKGAHDNNERRRRFPELFTDDDTSHARHDSEPEF